MTPLTDKRLLDWARYGGVQPFDSSYINSASIDLRLYYQWRDLENPDKLIIAQDITLYAWSLRTAIHNAIYDHLPHMKVFRRPTALLAMTKEYIQLPNNYAAEVKLKTTPSRLGLGHPIADWVDPGYAGHLTLMLHAVKTIRLCKDMPVCQLVVYDLGDNVQVPYGVHGHYQGQYEPTIAWTRSVNDE